MTPGSAGGEGLVHVHLGLAWPKRLWTEQSICIYLLIVTAIWETPRERPMERTQRLTLPGRFKADVGCLSLSLSLSSSFPPSFILSCPFPAYIPWYSSALRVDHCFASKYEIQQLQVFLDNLVNVGVKA